MKKEGTLSDEQVVAATRDWVEKVVIGLTLCPFAKAVQVKNQVRYVVSDAHTPKALQVDLENELKTLVATDPETLDTTLLIHPYTLTDFLDYNDFLDVAEEVLDACGLTGEIQIASFHPHYQFAGTEPDDIGNYTNRSPFPILHLLREASIEKAVDAFPDTEEIFEKNIETLQRLGMEGLRALLGTDSEDQKTGR